MLAVEKILNRNKFNRFRGLNYVLASLPYNFFHIFNAGLAYTAYELYSKCSLRTLYGMLEKYDEEIFILSIAHRY